MIKAKQTILTFALLVFGLTIFINSNWAGTKMMKNEFINHLDDINIKNYSSNIYDSIAYPLEHSFTNKVLTIGVFHQDEVWKNAENGKWVGIFKNKTAYYLAETKLEISRVNDPILDENEHDKTGWEVQTDNKDTAIILVEGLKNITPHKIQEATFSTKEIFPGDTLTIHYLGINYKIFATGNRLKVQQDPIYYNLTNYKLYITATIKGKLHTSLLVTQPDFDDQMINLIFAGDIDGDGFLDLIIDTSRHYNVTSPTIYLSKPAGKQEVVKPIGGHTSVGC